MISKLGKLPILLVFGLLGCAPQTPYDLYTSGQPLRGFPFKAGATYTSMESDAVNCQVEAAQRVPQQIVAQTTPTYTTPVQTSCNQIGTQTFCNSTGGQTYGGQTQLSDANTGLRQMAYAQCMVRNGYQSADIPACPAGTQPTSLRTSTSGGLLPLSNATCYLVTPSGQQFIGSRT